MFLFRVPWRSALSKAPGKVLRPANAMILKGGICPHVIFTDLLLVEMERDRVEFVRRLLNFHHNRKVRWCPLRLLSGTLLEEVVAVSVLTDFAQWRYLKVKQQ